MHVQIGDERVTRNVMVTLFVDEKTFEVPVYHKLQT